MHGNAQGSPYGRTCSGKAGTFAIRRAWRRTCEVGRESIRRGCPHSLYIGGVQVGPMNVGTGTARLGATFGIAAIAAILALGVVLRLVDPLSSPVIPAEDPYTHMAIVREDLRTGELQPLTEGADLYPPGLHAFLAAVLVFS